METETKNRQLVVGVVILHYKNETDTVSCIESLHNTGQAYPHTTIITVLNASTPDFADVLRRKFPHITLVANEANVGFAEGNNTGIRSALNMGCQSIILLNNDTVVSKNLVSSLSSYLAKNRSVGILSPKIYFAPGFEFHHDRYTDTERGKVLWYVGGSLDWATVYARHLGVDLVDQGQNDTIIETDFATGCCMIIKRKVFETIGLLDYRYFLYYEDVDFCIRAHRAGFHIRYYPGAHLWHKNASSSDKPGSITHVYYQTRNRLYFGYKYAPFRTKKSLFIESLGMIARGGIRSKAVKDYYMGRMGNVSSDVL